MRRVKVLGSLVGAFIQLAISTSVEAATCNTARFGTAANTRIAQGRYVHLTYDSTIKGLTGAIKWKIRDGVVAAASKWNTAPCQSPGPLGIQWPIFNTFASMNTTRTPGFTEAPNRENDYLDVKIGYAQNSSSGCATYNGATSRMTLFKTYTKNGVTGSCPLGELFGFVAANSQYNGDWVQDFVSLVAHELGHTIGLGDSGVADTDGCIMSGLKAIGGNGNRRYRKPADNISYGEAKKVDQLINPLMEVIDECDSNPNCATSIPGGGGGGGADVTFAFDPYEPISGYDFPVPDIDLLAPNVTYQEVYCIFIPVAPYTIYYTCDGSAPVDGKGC